MKQTIVMAFTLFILGITTINAQDNNSSKKDSNTTTTESNTTINKENNVSSTENNNTSDANSTINKFSFVPPKPSTPSKLMASVELGAEGFNYFIIKIDKNKNWELKKAKYGYSLIYEGKSDINSLTKGLKKYISETVKSGVDSSDIHFLISSGAQLKKDSSKVIKAVEQNKYIVNKITAKNEGIYGYWATVPKKFQDNSFFVDIGTGNTKIVWMENNKLKTLSTFGAKYYLDKDDNKTVYNSVKNLLKDKIPSKNRKNCFIIGGVPYKLAKSIRKDKERYTVLLDVNKYQNNLKKYKLEKKKYQAGLNIYKAIQDATNTKNFIFDWNSNFTIGYLVKLPFKLKKKNNNMELNKKEKRKSDNSELKSIKDKLKQTIKSKKSEFYFPGDK